MRRCRRLQNRDIGDKRCLRALFGIRHFAFDLMYEFEGPGERA